MKPPSAISRLSGTLLLWCSASLCGTLTASLPEKMQGYQSSDFEIKTDSVTDFSAVAKYGTACDWNYHILSAGEIIENRGSEWRRYALSKDSLILNHIESSREQRNFLLPLSYSGSKDTIPYVSLSRRDMSFDYIDVGTVVVRYPLEKSTLIMSDGDTISDCNLQEITIDFHRYKTEFPDTAKVDADNISKLAFEIWQKVDSTGVPPVKRIVERESTWRKSGALYPYAISRKSSAISTRNDTVETFYAVCFPGITNDIHTATPTAITRYKQDNGKSRKETEIGKGPIKVMINGRQLSVIAPGAFKLSVSDISGKSMIYRHSEKAEYTENLDHLPQGEYVVWVKSGEEVFSQTLSLRP